MKARRGRKEDNFRAQVRWQFKILAAVHEFQHSAARVHAQHVIYSTHHVHIIELVIKVHELRKHLVPRFSPSTMWLRKKLSCEPSQLVCTYWPGPYSRVRREWVWTVRVKCYVNLVFLSFLYHKTLA
jgi:hypothetical protein